VTGRTVSGRTVIETPATGRWQRRPGSRRDELLDAALRLFVRQGVGATTVADIAIEAGVAKGSLYRYFAAKEALLSALKDRFFEQMMQCVSDAVDAMPDAGFFERADAAIGVSTRFLFDQADLVELWGDETSSPEASDEFSRGITSMAAVYEAAIDEAVASGDIDCADPHATALLLVYAVEGTATHAIRHDHQPDCERIIGAAQAMTRRVLGPSG
jgi:AcrR family transcriptional regulator